ncbi:hypothetical protein K9M59_02030 [Candidatus Gracilibacteria bacterium]|nr:hypothetical protein [Candidatus Gracilibacteria bacterium]MCF7819626.1 hypothetical protein [Candidatus Gracilibacteria bacterium]
MKRFFSSVLLGLLWVGVANAQEFEFEVIRTPEVPGFFMVRIFSGAYNTPLPIQNVFVQNYNEENAESYEELIPFIQEFGGKIIKPQSLQENLESQFNRIVFLGGDPQEGFLHYQIPENRDLVLEEFEVFAREYLGPIFMSDITAEFGGNISEVFPEKIDFLGIEPVYFVGKFEKAMKTRMEIRGISAEGEIRAVAPLHLQVEEFARGPLARELPFIWEEFWKLANPEESEGETSWNITLVDIFPALLFLIGIIILYRVIVALRKRKHEEESFEEQLTQSSPPSGPQWDREIPFSVEKKEDDQPKQSE